MNTTFCPEVLKYDRECKSIVDLFMYLPAGAQLTWNRTPIEGS